MIQIAETHHNWPDVVYIVAFILGPILASVVNVWISRQAAKKLPLAAQVLASATTAAAVGVKADLKDRSDRQDTALDQIQNAVNGRFDAVERNLEKAIAHSEKLSQQLVKAGIVPNTE